MNLRTACPRPVRGVRHTPVAVNRRDCSMRRARRPVIAVAYHHGESYGIYWHTVKMRVLDGCPALDANLLYCRIRQFAPQNCCISSEDKSYLLDSDER